MITTINEYKIYLERNNNITNRLLQFNFYSVIESGELFTEVLGVYKDKEEALSEAEHFDTIDKDTTTVIIVYEYRFNIPLNVMLDKLSYTVEDYEDEIISDDDLIDEYFDSKYSDDDEYYDIVNIYSRTIEPINMSSDILIDDVIKLLNNHFNVRNKFSKYTNLYKTPDGDLTLESDNGKDYDDEEYVKYDYITIRIADHTHNPRNGRNDINVVISNDDKTKNRFFTARTDLHYNSDDDANDIIYDILNYYK